MIHNCAYKFLLPSVLAGMLIACSGNDELIDGPIYPEDNSVLSPVPDFNYSIEPFDPTFRAEDSYTPGDDNDIYWQANNFKTSVDIEYDGPTAKVSSSSNDIDINISGAHVAVEINSDTKTQIRLTGKSDEGSLKIYSQAKVLLILDNVDLKSDIGPAVNSQSKKRLFVHASDNSTNTLADAEVYSDDKYYKQASSADIEDRKGAFFSEDNTIFSGKGLITIKANNRHALATDGSLRVLPGTTLCVESYKKNAIHAKGSSKEFGISIEGGYLYALCTGEAARCIKSDLDIYISNATLSLNNSSSAIFDDEENDTSSPAAIKSNASVVIKDSEIYIKMTGDGAKGVNSDINVEIAGSDITMTSTGVRYTHGSSSASPSGIKADGMIEITSGDINVAMYGEDLKSDALVCNGNLLINGGNVYSYAHGNCLNSESQVNISAGRVYAFSESKEAVDAGIAVNISGGITLTHSPVAIVNAEPVLNVGPDATLIAAGGNSMTNASPSSTTAIRFEGINVAAGTPLSILTDSSLALFSMVYLAPCNDCPILIASPDFTKGSSWKLTTGGSIPDTMSGWNGFYQDTAASSPVTSTDFSI